VDGLRLFFSYAREDRPTVEGVRDICRDRGAEPWMDTHDIPPTARWWEEIQEAIDAGDAFVFFLSRASLRAHDTCLEELAYASDHAKRIVTVKLEDVSGLELPKPIVDPQWIAAEDLDTPAAVADRVLAAAVIDLAHIRAHTGLLQRAKEWRRDPRHAHFLSSRELRSVEDLILAPAAGGPQLLDVQREFIAASRSRRRRRRQVQGALAAVVLAVFLAAFIAALLERNRAVTQSDIARSRDLAAEATAQIAADPQAASALAVQAWEAFPSDTAEVALRRAFAEFHLSRDVQVNSAVAVVSADPSVNAITAVAFSPDDRYLVTGSKDGVVRVWPWPALIDPIVEDESEDEAIETVEFSADDRYVVSGRRNGRVNVWQWHGAPHGLGVNAHQGPIRDAQFNPSDDSELAVAGADGSLRLWHWRHATSTLVTNRDGGARNIFYIPGGSRGAILSGGSDGIVRIWSVPPLPAGGRIGELVHTAARAGSITSMALREATLVTGSTDGGLREWDWSHGLIAGTLHAHGSPAAVALSGDRLAAAVGNRITVWFPEAGPTESFTAGEASVTAMAFSGTGDQLVSVASDGSLHVWNVSQRAQGLQLFSTRAGAAGVAFSPDGKEVAVAGNDNATRVWDLANPSRAPTVLRQPAQGRQGRATGSDVAFDPTGQFVAVGSTNGFVRVWSLTQPSRPVHALRVSGAEVLALAFSHDGCYIASASDGATQIWSWRNRARIEAASEPSQAGVEGAVAFGPSDDIVASGDGFGHILLWKWRRGPKVRVLAMPDHQEISSLAFSPDGRRLVSGTLSGNLLRVWNVRTGSSIETHDAGGAQWGAAFTSDGRSVISVGEDGTLNVWPWAAGVPPISVGGFARPVVAQPFVEVAAFDPQRAEVATAGNGALMVRQCHICAPAGSIVASARKQGLTHGGG
jgi:WD40 repeat protein